MSGLFLLLLMPALVLVALGVARWVGFWAALGVLVAGLVTSAVGIHGVVVSAKAAMHAEFAQDCRLVGGCGPDVIVDFCAPSPAACPFVGTNGNRGQQPAEGSPAYVVGER